MIIRQAVGAAYTPGTSLTLKFSLLVSGLLVVVAAAWGLSVAIISRAALMEQIYQQGSNTVKILAIAGSGVVKQFEETGIVPEVDLSVLKQFAPGVESQVAAAAIYTLPDLKTLVSLGTLREIGNRERITSVRVESAMTLERALATFHANGREVEWRCVHFEYPVPNVKTKAKAMLLLSAEKVNRKVNRIVLSMALVGLVFVLFGVGLSFLLANMVTQPIKQLAADMVVVARGDLGHFTRVASGDEIGLLASSFNHMVGSLREAKEVEKEAERIQSELDAAREIQANLLPEKIPEIPGYDFRAYYNSAKEVGGDYYDIFGLDYEHVALVVADVSGKGIPGSMEMARTRTILRIVAGSAPSAAATVLQTNALVAKQIKRGMFVTLYYAVLEIPTRRLTCVSAGHNAMYVYRAANGQVEAVNPNGIALGFDPGPIFERTLQEKTIQLHAGDRFVLYTDGIVEAMSPSHEEFGDERFINVIKANPKATSRDFVNTLMRAIAEHQKEAEQHDDITIVTGRIL